MDRLRALVREPALLIDAFESLVVVLVALGLFNLHGDTQTNLIAVFIALLAIVKGALTKPFPVTVIPDFGRAFLVFCVSLGVLAMTADQVTLVATFLGTLMTVVQRAQITPRSDPVARAGGAGAGPLTGRTDAGYGSPLLGLAVVLLVAGILVLLFTHLWVIGLILCVVGIALLFAPVFTGAGGSRRY